MMDITRIEEISIEAGNAVMRLRQDGFSTSSKSDGSPVTEADLAADAIITSGLTTMAPDIPAITEETWSCSKDHEPQEYWCIDPIDGTKGFISGKPDFTVNIALIRDRFPVLGVIYAPALGLLWGGSDGKAWKRQASAADDAMTLDRMGAPHPISARDARIETPDVVATKAHRSPELNAWIDRLGANSSTSVGSSLKFCVLAEGKADLYPRTGPTMEWDTAAGQAILEAAGGSVIGPDEQRFSYGKPDRLNGYFCAMAKITRDVPPLWLPPALQVARHD
ncbi:MAG: 3'(2'),5'-bisphosphate nucleotidase CysQ [Alphaproteobacteria bacterium]|nr:3'(2'),5'-bisphosphate nucleotidase CysQ [Alphaproteobacteria bacterium]